MFHLKKITWVIKSNLLDYIFSIKNCHKEEGEQQFSLRRQNRRQWVSNCRKAERLEEKLSNCEHSKTVGQIASGGYGLSFAGERRSTGT